MSFNPLKYIPNACHNYDLDVAFSHSQPLSVFLPIGHVSVSVSVGVCGCMCVYVYVYMCSHT